MAEFEKYYSLAEAGEILHRSRVTSRAYIASGLLKARKLKPGAKNSKFIIAESALKEFIDNSFIDGKAPAGYYQELYPRPHKKDNE